MSRVSAQEAIASGKDHERKRERCRNGLMWEERRKEGTHDASSVGTQENIVFFGFASFFVTSTFPLPFSFACCCCWRYAHRSISSSSLLIDSSRLLAFTFFAVFPRSSSLLSSLTTSTGFFLPIWVSAKKVARVSYTWVVFEGRAAALAEDAVDVEEASLQDFFFGVLVSAWRWRRDSVNEWRELSPASKVARRSSRALVEGKRSAAGGGEGEVEESLSMGGRGRLPEGMVSSFRRVWRQSSRKAGKRRGKEREEERERGGVTEDESSSC
jgi:hypothetical protein